MQPRARSIFDLFDGKKRYVVPLFQRQYVWNKEDQWEPLWEDIERKLRERFSNKNGPAHFLGAMVIDQIRVYGNAVPAHLVIDGQQRLTTFQIFLSAFRDVCNIVNQEIFADECGRYLSNTGVMEDKDTEVYKVWPTNLDREYFTDIINAGSRNEIINRYPLIYRRRKPEPRPTMIDCYLFFYEKINYFINDDYFPLKIDEKVARFHETLRSCLQVVTIELEGEDDPQLIFETLNARGEPLLPSDLLRNFIFWRASRNKEPQEELYLKYWLPFDRDFWKKEEKQGRLFRPLSDIFLQHYLTLKRMDDIGIGHLFTEYKYWINTNTPFTSVKEELEDLEKHRGYFVQLVNPQPNTAIYNLAKVLSIFDIRTIYPLLMGILEKELEDEVAEGIFCDLISYVVRRAICNLGTKNYNKIFLSILSKLSEISLTRRDFRKLLLDLQGESSVWPRDDIFKEAWLTKPCYDFMMASRIQYILKNVEYELHFEKNEEIEILSDLSIEHIMPDAWIEHWPLKNGHKGVEFMEIINGSREKEDIDLTLMHQSLKHSFGNLTLLTQPLNSSISNNTYAVKKPEIVRNSALALNRYFLDIKNWDEDDIKKRGEIMFELARIIWPYPEAIRD
ncbi:MAG TPA: DUF262 domain-containing HNH endonuclease family protein [Smithella sp.]|nr:DUF262 domain-containing HNH endonuclease family protein [Smithella sp.]